MQAALVSDPERKQLSSSAVAPLASSLGPPRSETRFKDGRMGGGGGTGARCGARGVYTPNIHRLMDTHSKHALFDGRERVKHTDWWICTPNTQPFTDTRAQNTPIDHTLNTHRMVKTRVQHSFLAFCFCTSGFPQQSVTSFSTRVMKKDKLTDLHGN